MRFFMLNFYFSSKNLAKYKFSPQSLWKFSNIIFFPKSIQWEPRYSIWTNGWTDSLNELNTHYSEMCGAPNRVHFILVYIKSTKHVLTLIWLEGAELSNAVAVVVDCYDVVSSTPDYCKRDISECYCVKKFVRIYKWELHFVRGRKLANCWTTFYQIKGYHALNNNIIRQCWFFLTNV